MLRGCALLLLVGCTPAYTLRGPPAIAEQRTGFEVAGAYVQTPMPPSFAAGTFEARRMLDSGWAQTFFRLNMSEVFFPSVVQTYYFAFDPRVGGRWVLARGPWRGAVEVSGSPDFFVPGNAIVFGATGGVAFSTAIRLGGFDLFASADGAGQVAHLGTALPTTTIDVVRLLVTGALGIAYSIGDVTAFITGGPIWNYATGTRVNFESPDGPKTATVDAPPTWMAAFGIRIH